MKTKKSRYRIIYDNKSKKPKDITANNISEAVEKALADKEVFTGVYRL
jgi:hypothetical protein